MNTLQLMALNEKQAREARKWLDYLATVTDPEKRLKEMTRKLTETWLEGKQFVDDGRMP